MFHAVSPEPLGDVEYVEIELSTTEEDEDKTWQVYTIVEHTRISMYRNVVFMQYSMICYS